MKISTVCSSLVALGFMALTLSSSLRAAQRLPDIATKVSISMTGVFLAFSLLLDSPIAQGIEQRTVKIVLAGLFFWILTFLIFRKGSKQLAPQHLKTPTKKGTPNLFTQVTFDAVIVAIAFVLGAREFGLRVSKGLGSFPAVTPGDEFWAIRTGIVLPILGYVCVARPKIGDLVSFHLGSGQQLLSRVIAVENDQIEMKDSRLFLNGKALERREIDPDLLWSSLTTHGFDTDFDRTVSPRVYEETIGEQKPVVTYGLSRRAPAGEVLPSDFPPTRVPAGSVFVLGDNRGVATDSRALGPIPIANVSRILQQ